MENVITLIEPYMLYIVMVLVVFCFILFIMFIMSFIKMKKIQRKYERFMIKDDVDLENLLIHYAKKVSQVKDNEEKILDKIDKLSNEIKYCTQKVGVVRYNAIEKVGADLSFAIAMMDAEDNGLVLNGIYSRDGSYIYSKPIKSGTSTYQLSDEEKEAIRLAIENNKAVK
ncbi:DUF4446 family protein [Niameybacter massiliensis]|uniref:DUF4446 family protein n=1 Tax=Holtiella tumoricola TaxID=3018743 RepID=A0AA42J0C5_9FIRM|nr:DUF4446 family protein [Holtiella tumoricola]MDA3730923.1 DUF4446 family protein [Holtiella tumoricola]